MATDAEVLAIERLSGQVNTFRLELNTTLSGIQKDVSSINGSLEGLKAYVTENIGAIKEDLRTHEGEIKEVKNEIKAQASLGTEQRILRIDLDKAIKNFEAMQIAMKEKEQLELQKKGLESDNLNRHLDRRVNKIAVILGSIISLLTIILNIILSIWSHK